MHGCELYKVGWEWALTHTHPFSYAPNTHTCVSLSIIVVYRFYSLYRSIILFQILFYLALFYVTISFICMSQDFYVAMLEGPGSEVYLKRYT